MGDMPQLTTSVRWRCSVLESGETLVWFGEDLKRWSSSLLRARSVLIHCQSIIPCSDCQVPAQLSVIRCHPAGNSCHPVLHFEQVFSTRFQTQFATWSTSIRTLAKPRSSISTKRSSLRWYCCYQHSFAASRVAGAVVPPVLPVACECRCATTATTICTSWLSTPVISSNLHDRAGSPPATSISRMTRRWPGNTDGWFGEVQHVIAMNPCSTSFLHSCKWVTCVSEHFVLVLCKTENGLKVTPQDEINSFMPQQLAVLLAKETLAHTP